MGPEQPSMGKFGFWSCFVILVNVMDGPGFLAIPKVYREAGWLIPTVGFVLVALVACLSGCCLVDLAREFVGPTSVVPEEEENAISDEADCTWLEDRSPRGSGASDTEGLLGTTPRSRKNEGGPREAEFCELATHFFGPTMGRVVEVMFYLCLLSLILAQIIIGAQVMDGFLIFLMGKTCAVELPHFGWTCTQAIALQPFGVGKSIVSGGFMVCMVLCLWLSALDISDNIMPQFISTGLLIFAAGTFFWHFASSTYDPLVPSRLNILGPDLAGVLGVVIFNYSFVTAIPCVLVLAQPSLNMKQVICAAVATMCTLYIIMGTLGSMAFDAPDADVMASLLKPDAPVITKLAVFGFTHAIVPCIPVYCLLLQSALVANFGMSKTYAYVLSSVCPWLVALAFYNGDFFDTLVRWAALLVNGVVNLVLPLAFTLQSQTLQFRKITTCWDVMAGLFRQPMASPIRTMCIVAMMSISSLILTNIVIALIFLVAFDEDLTND